MATSDATTAKASAHASFASRPATALLTTHLLIHFGPPAEVSLDSLRQKKLTQS